MRSLCLVSASCCAVGPGSVQVLQRLPCQILLLVVAKPLDLILNLASLEAVLQNPFHPKLLPVLLVILLVLLRGGCLFLCFRRDLALERDRVRSVIGDFLVGEGSYLSLVLTAMIVGATQ